MRRNSPFAPLYGLTGPIAAFVGAHVFYADPDIGEAAATVWEQKFGKKPEDNVFNSNALFYFLGEKGFKEEGDGGRLIEFTITYAANTTFRSYTELETLDTTRVSVFEIGRAHV